VVHCLRVYSGSARLDLFTLGPRNVNFCLSCLITYVFLERLLYTYCIVIYDVDYLCANFGLPTSLCSGLWPDVRDRQTSDARHRLMPPPIRGGGIIGINQL